MLFTNHIASGTIARHILYTVCSLMCSHLLLPFRTVTIPTCVTEVTFTGVYSLLIQQQPRMWFWLRSRWSQKRPISLSQLFWMSWFATSAALRPSITSHRVRSLKDGPILVELCRYGLLGKFVGWILKLEFMSESFSLTYFIPSRSREGMLVRV